MSTTRDSNQLRRSHAEVVREIAKYMDEGLGASQATGRCGAHRDGPATCTCFRINEHEGDHRCVCGSVWGSL